MGVFTARLTALWERLTDDQFAVTGRTTDFELATAKLVGADRYAAQTIPLSAGLSAQQVTLSPLGPSAPATLICLMSDHPIDVRTNAASDTVFLSGISLLFFAGHISSLFVTTGDADTLLTCRVAGGSNATLQTSLPLP